jgi:hypothetical protein
MHPPALQVVTTVGVRGAEPGVGDGEDGCGIAVTRAGGKAGGAEAFKEPMPVAAIEGKLAAHNINVDTVKNSSFRLMIFPYANRKAAYKNNRFISMMRFLGLTGDGRIIKRCSYARLRPSRVECLLPVGIRWTQQSPGRMHVDWLRLIRRGSGSSRRR